MKPRLRWLVDENMSPNFAAMLSRSGQDAIHQAQTGPGILDPTVLATAAADGRIVLTFDKGFGALVYHHRVPAVGVVQVRTSVDPNDDPLDRLEKALPEILRLLPGMFISLDSRVRPRPLP